MIARSFCSSLAFHGCGAARGRGSDDAIYRAPAQIAMGTGDRHLLRIRGRLAAGIVVTLRGQLNLRVLRFVTLVPVVLAIAAVLRLGAPALDATLSARPLSQEVSRVDNRSSSPGDSATATRDRIWPAVLSQSKYPALRTGTNPGRRTSLGSARRLAEKHCEVDTGRRVTYLGSLAAQGLDYYWVAGKSGN